MGTVVFRRPPRQAGPQVPSGDIQLEPPPDLPQTPPRTLGQLLMILPMLAGMGAMAFMYAGRGGGNSAMPWITGALFGVSMLGMGISQFTAGGDKRGELDQSRRDYMRHLAQARKRVRDVGAGQQAALRWNQPEPEALWSLAASSRRWERRSGDADFCEVRVAVGAQKLAVDLLAPDTKPAEDLEPLTAMALRRFVRAHATVPEAPMAVSLRSFHRVIFRGDRAAYTDLSRSMVCQLATFHSPDDLRIVVVTDTQRVAEWSWVKWLPHNLYEQRSDAAGPLRLVFSGVNELEQLLHGELTARPRHDAKSPAELPHLVVVHDGGQGAPEGLLTAQGVTVLDLSGDVPQGNQRGLLVLDVTDREVREVGTGSAVGSDGADSTITLGLPDQMTFAQAEGLARQLSPYRLSVRADATETTVTNTGLPRLLGLDDVTDIDPGVSWKPRLERDRLRVPIGTDPNGDPVELDVKEAAHGGMGPHGLIVGATGSGKSELLRTLVAALAVRHSPEELNLILVDFKGGATFGPLSSLPHTSAVITNLAQELPLVDRMRDAIAGELNRRQELLRHAGNYVSRHSYEQARMSGADLVPMPSLLLVCDEFSEMLAAKPEFIDLFVQIGRIGRSIGVHLLLASQRLEEGRLRGLDTHLSYRIGLRTFSAAESRIVLGVSDAYELPNAPGHAYLKRDTQTLQQFRAAYVSGTYRAVGGGSGRRGSQAGRRIVPYDVGYVPVVEPVGEMESAMTVGPAPETEVESTGNEPTVLDVIVERLRGQGIPAHQVWLPPLAEPPSIAELLPTSPTPLKVTIGIVDRPYEQRRDPLVVELDGAAGHVAIVGGPQSGKSNALRALLTSAALTHTPREMQFYCLDLGGGSLAALR
ncbi:MAG: type VII secretion protein EccCa, partial [Longispora sp.]|nr:type VII secretion protein EccCa [Longispora sp. (in: high G+C Gram-positive bacteria)]